MLWIRCSMLGVRRLLLCDWNVGPCCTLGIENPAIEHGWSRDCHDSPVTYHYSHFGFVTSTAVELFHMQQSHFAFATPSSSLRWSCHLDRSLHFVRRNIACSANGLPFLADPHFDRRALQRVHDLAVRPDFAYHYPARRRLASHFDRPPHNPMVEISLVGTGAGSCLRGFGHCHRPAYSLRSWTQIEFVRETSTLVDYANRRSRWRGRRTFLSRLCH
jgi:hypothetical protein